ncbi:MAG: hypothetical protein P4M14_06495 [Gammaproteobacteria bacterium]|nr:hypothetical protein [Gammaproteobacteria bacterium]
MKRLLLAILIILVSSHAFAKSPLKAPVEILVKIDFHSSQNKNGQDEQKKSQTKLIMDASKNQWQTVETIQASSSADPSHFFILLSKIDKADAEKVALSFLVLDSSKKGNFILQPTMITRYGQESALELTNGDRKLKLKLVADNIPA